MSVTSSFSDAERMDRHYRFQRWVYDATRTHYLIGRKTLIRRLGPAHGQSVLEIGCGTAWNLAQMARVYPDARLFGVDVSQAMLSTARASLARRGLSERVELAQGDATAFSPRALFGESAFDRIVFSYALSMIPGWEAALEHAAGMLAPRGELHIVDFGQCEELPGAVKAMLFAFLRHYSVTPRRDLPAKAERIAAAFNLDVSFDRIHRGYTDYIVLRR